MTMDAKIKNAVERINKAQHKWLLKVAAELVAEGVPVDAIKIQHIPVNEPDQIRYCVMVGGIPTKYELHLNLTWIGKGNF